MSVLISTVQRDGLALRNIKEQTPEVCLAAVQQNGNALRYVKENTPEVCLAAVQQNEWALGYVKAELKTPELCLIAVQQDGTILQLVDVQTPELCLAAVENDISALVYVSITDGFQFPFGYGMENHPELAIEVLRSKKDFIGKDAIWAFLVNYTFNNKEKILAEFE